jgi:hypothetical protein
LLGDVEGVMAGDSRTDTEVEGTVKALSVKEHGSDSFVLASSSVLLLDRDPFSIEDILPESLTTNEKDGLIELSCDGSLQQMFKKMDFTEFWLARRKEYPLISDKAVKFLLVFSTTYFVYVVFLQ